MNKSEVLSVESASIASRYVTFYTGTQTLFQEGFQDFSISGKRMIPSIVKTTPQDFFMFSSCFKDHAKKAVVNLSAVI